ncbi:integrator complex subunit 2 [Holotrichia oblita]|uniref:Integrator complex subunit 2 n=1 Tax=Holotrichia oblita TaxID=644536 RepID=A0ACB9SHY5_HOLOL|nr:integrator complex subunit 2 [Holotrichia oblita]
MKKEMITHITDTTSAANLNLELFVTAKIDQAVKNITKLEDTKELQHLPSLRPIKDDQEQFNLLDVTPEFQKFVAKRLGEYLEKDLQKRLTFDIKYKPRKRCKKAGVKLFRNSSDFISLKKDIVDELKLKRVEIKRRTIESDDTGESAKIKSCAVDPNDILSRRETEFWTPRRKGEVFDYKRTQNGQLVSIEKEFS